MNIAQNCTSGPVYMKKAGLTRPVGFFLGFFVGLFFFLYGKRAGS